MNRNFTKEILEFNVDDKISTLNESWQKKERLRFIDTKLFWTGTIRRSEICEAFQIHWTNASKDLTLYQKLAEKNVIYDKNAKIYRTTSEFGSISKSHSLLNLLAYTNLDMPCHGYIPNLLFSVNIPVRQPDTEIVRDILQSAHNESAIEINYRSMANPDGKIRYIYPQTIIFDGLRWHLRAYDESHGDYRDFVLSRIKRTGSTKERNVYPPDAEWHKVSWLEIRPHSKLTDKQKKMIEYDYSMQNSSLKIEVRNATAQYLIRVLNLDTNLEPPRQQIECVNLKEFDSY
ncbi:WYL domain-containing protein [Pseudoalteromonas denitrificans]|uniref:WYL domain-containing protein n=1 Tax=Pseudoalteromonas denitrificans DSM 6059 TaxID=1123010 RepID=A0A1I1JNN7_9GAMM|nr:WYL domain-containing protein [Pseudoalteromonas denitrificans]SFC47513.1 WYL domain-containing protein [Pseudoalteromonas denitrificans DSM 6059]